MAEYLDGLRKSGIRGFRDVCGDDSEEKQKGRQELL